MDEVRDLYRDRKYKTASARLRQLADELDRMETGHKGPIFPKEVAGWTVRDTQKIKRLKPTGLAVTYYYKWRDKGIYMSLHKGSEEAIRYIRMITHPGWLRKTRARVYKIKGYEVIMTSDRTIHVALDRDTLLEVKGDSDKDTTESDLLRFTRDLDFHRLRWVE